MTVHNLYIYHKSGSNLFDEKVGSIEVDPSLITGYLTALYSFGSAISPNKNNPDETRMVHRVQGYTIVTESGRLVNASLAVDPEDNEKEVSRSLRMIIDSFENRHSESLQNFNGQLTAYQEFGEFMNKKIDESFKKIMRNKLHEIYSEKNGIFRPIQKAINYVVDIMVAKGMNSRIFFEEEWRNIFDIRWNQLIAPLSNKIGYELDITPNSLDDDFDYRYLSPSILELWGRKYGTKFKMMNDYFEKFANKLESELPMCYTEVLLKTFSMVHSIYARDTRNRANNKLEGVIKQAKKFRTLNGKVDEIKRLIKEPRPDSYPDLTKSELIGVTEMLREYVDQFDYAPFYKSNKTYKEVEGETQINFEQSNLRKKGDLIWFICAIRDHMDEHKKMPSSTTIEILEKERFDQLEQDHKVPLLYA